MSVDELVRGWLHRGNTGCVFSAMLAKVKQRIAMAPFSALATVDDIDALFDYASNEHRPAVAILTGARTERELVDQILALSPGSRWNVFRVRPPATLATADVLIGMEWQTSAGHWASPMGLAPFPTMPATRRAPVACLAAWTGGRENTFKKKIEPVVHFLDADVSVLKLDSARYAKHRKRSERETARLLFDDRADHYRNVAFRLSPDTATALAALPVR